MNSEVKHDCINRLSKILGQVGGLSRMVEANRPCKETLQQINSVRAAIEQVGVLFLSEHLKSCVLQQREEGDEGCHIEENQQAEEIKRTLTRFLR